MKLAFLQGFKRCLANMNREHYPGKTASQLVDGGDIVVRYRGIMVAAADDVPEYVFDQWFCLFSIGVRTAYLASYVIPVC